MSRINNEIAHGRMLAESGAEDAWGWQTPAGKVRAERRGMLISQAANLNASKSALEIGCGTGLFTMIFSETGASILAVDISPELIELAEQKKVPNGNVKYECQRFEDISTERLFDAVIGSSVLHHLEVDEAIRVIYKQLKPGGVMVFAEPNMLNPQILMERTLLRPFFKNVSPDETAFVRWSLAKTLKREGFERIEIRPYDWLHPLVPTQLIKPVSKVGLLIESLPLLREFAGSLIIQAYKPK